MKNSKFRFWQKWLTYANILTIGIGFLCAFLGNSIFFELHNAQTKEVFFAGEEFSSGTLAMKNWLFGVIGGTIVGFHLLMVFISENAFKRKERWAYYAMWSGMISWFLIDSAISYYTGAVHNVVLINLPAMVMIGLPLLMTWKAFK